MIDRYWRQDTAFFSIQPDVRDSGYLDVGDGHRIWWEETGPADGCPILVVHGGPGGSIRPSYRRLLDPKRHRGVFFDQRGCGKSTPAGSLNANDTAKLVADMEALRLARGINRWVVLGGSWGSTLSLAYAQAHPAAVSGLVLSGVFLARKKDIDWWWNGVAQVFPEVVAARDAILHPAERSDARRTITERILFGDEEIRREAAAALMYSELQTLDLYPSPLPDDPSAIGEAVITYGQLFAHYDRNDFFLDEGQLLEGAGRLSEAGIRGWLVAGRSDMCTPPGGAFDLHKAWDGSSLTIVAGAGHRWADEVLARALVPAICEAASWHLLPPRS